jgi:hypothetical protein
MQVDAFAIRLRPRSNVEAADLGTRLCQAAARSIYGSYVPVAAVVMALSAACFPIAAWLPGLALWLSKPWLDRTILFALSRAAFGQQTTAKDLWQSQRQVWWSQLAITWTIRRLSPWRSFTQPVYQLEGLKGAQLRKRLAQIRSGRTSAAAGMMSVFATVELALIIGLLSLLVWLAPAGYELKPEQLLSGASSSAANIAIFVAYAAAILFLEPFYVASGFTLYLDRRAQLEAWDIEQEFRRAFGG